MGEKVINRRITWNVVNVKARREQTPEHYVQAFRKIEREDPLIDGVRGKNLSVKNISESEILDANGQPSWIVLTILSYTIIDPDAFYNIRRHEDISMDWDSDVVANKKEAEIYFIPSVHHFAVRKNSDISLVSIIDYLRKALEVVEPHGFDVDAVVERDILERILSAKKIISVEADISFSNHANTSGFSEVFERKTMDMNADKLKIIATGTKESPLFRGNDGLVDAIINMSEHNGQIKAVIMENDSSPIEFIDTNSHPFILMTEQVYGDFANTISIELRTLYGKKDEK